MTDIHLTKEDLAELMRAPTSQSVASGMILKWVAGIIGSVASAILVAVLIGVTTTLSAHNNAIASIKAQQEQARALKIQNDIVLNEKLDRIEANTKDRITRSDTMREVSDLQEDINRVNDMALKAMDMLVERGTFMVTTQSRLAELEKKVDISK